MPYSSTWKTLKESASASASAVGTSFYLSSPSCKLNKIDHFTVSSSFSFFIRSKSNHQFTKQRLQEKALISRRKNHHGVGEFSVVHCKDMVTCKGEEPEFTSDETSKGASPIVPEKFSAKRKIIWRNRKLRSVILLNVVTIVYASNILVVKEAESYMDAAAFTAVRFVISAIPFLPFVFEARNDVQIRKAGMELGLWISLGHLMEAAGLLTAEAGRASFISLFTVIVVPVFGSMLGTSVPTHTWCGILISVLGMAILESSGSAPNVGDLLNFLSAIFFGIHTLRTEHVSRKTKEGNFLALLGYEVCVVALVSTLWYLIRGTSEAIQEGERTLWTWPLVWDSVVSFPWIPALYSGVFSTGLCLWAEFAAMKYISAIETAVIYGMEPIWGAAFAWFILGERWELPGWIGAALILGGSLTVQMHDTNPPESRKQTGKNDDKPDMLVVSESQKQRKNLTAAPVIVSSKDVLEDKLKK